jgi:hypothetical protein
MKHFSSKEWVACGFGLWTLQIISIPKISTGIQKGFSLFLAATFAGFVAWVILKLRHWKNPAQIHVLGSCSHCDGSIEFPEYGIGEFYPCPHCQKETMLALEPDKRNWFLRHKYFTAYSIMVFLVSARCATAWSESVRAEQLAKEKATIEENQKWEAEMKALHDSQMEESEKRERLKNVRIGRMLQENKWNEEAHQRQEERQIRELNERQARLGAIERERVIRALERQADAAEDVARELRLQNVERSTR